MRIAILLATVLGLIGALFLMDQVGFAAVLAAVARIGAFGFTLYTAYTALVLLLLGAAWYAVAPGEPPRRIALFMWGRTTREAATDVLPFSQFGGLVVGARTIATQGVSEAVVYASMIADMTTEMAAQLIYTLFGVAVLTLVLTRSGTDAGLLWTAFAGLGVTAGLMAAILFGQKPLLDLVGRFGAKLLPGAAGAVRGIREQLTAVYTMRGRVAAAFAFNMAAWIASGAGAWIALRLIGVELPLWKVLTIESLIFTLRSVAFMVPGAIGLQEAAYLLVGPVFGLGPEAGLALSLLKRARDLAIGVPALLVWQVGESRRVAREMRT